jgi:hypothetical protein
MKDESTYYFEQHKIFHLWQWCITLHCMLGRIKQTAPLELLHLPIQILPVLSRMNPGSHSHSYEPTLFTQTPLKQASGPSSLHSLISSHTCVTGFSWVPVGQMHCTRKMNIFQILWLEGKRKWNSFTWPLQDKPNIMHSRLKLGWCKGQYGPQHIPF